MASSRLENTSNSELSASSVEIEDDFNQMATEFEVAITSILKECDKSISTHVVDKIKEETRQLKHSLQASTSSKRSSFLQEHVEKISELQNSIAEIIEENECLRKRCSEIKKLQGDNEALNEYIENFDKHHTAEVGRLKAKLSMVRIAENIKKQSKEKVAKDRDNVHKSKTRKYSLFRKKRSARETKLDQTLILSDSAPTQGSIESPEAEVVMTELEELCGKLEATSLLCHDLTTENKHFLKILQEKEDDLLEAQQVIAMSDRKLAEALSCYKDLSKNLENAQSKLSSLNTASDAMQNELLEQKFCISTYQKKLSIVFENVEAMNKLIVAQENQLDEYEISIREQKDIYSEAVACWKELAKTSALICVEADMQVPPEALRLLHSMSNAIPGLGCDEQLCCMKSQLEDLRFEARKLEEIRRARPTPIDMPSCHDEAQQLQQLQEKVAQQRHELEGLRNTHKKTVRNLRLQTSVRKKELQMQLERAQLQTCLAEEALQKKDKEARNLELVSSKLSEEHEAMQKVLGERLDAQVNLTQELSDRNAKLIARCEQMQNLLDSSEMAVIRDCGENRATERFKSLLSENKNGNLTSLFELNSPRQGLDDQSEKYLKRQLERIYCNPVEDEAKLVGGHSRSTAETNVLHDSRKSYHQDELHPRRTLLARPLEEEPNMPMQGFSHDPWSTPQFHYALESSVNSSSGLSIDYHRASSGTMAGMVYPTPYANDISYSATAGYLDQPTSDLSRVSIANRFIMNTFEEGHSLIEGIFVEKDRLQRELEEARQSRRSSHQSQISCASPTFHKPHMN